MTKPKLILICRGGIIQQAIANTEIEVINLDYDIMADGPPPFRESYEDRTMGDIEVADDFKAEEEDAKQEWDKAMGEHFKKNRNEN